MISRFHSSNFDPNIDQRTRAESGIERIEEAAPYASTVLGIGERSDKAYGVSIDVYSKLGIFSATAQDAQFEEALRLVEEKIFAKLDAWKRERFVATKDLVPLGRPKDWVAIA